MCNRLSITIAITIASCLSLVAPGLRPSLLLTAAAFVLVAGAPAAAQTTLKLAVANINEGLLPIRVAIDRGFFKAEGIAVELMQFRGGGPAVQAFASRSVDLCTCAADHVVRLVNRGLDARIIVGLDEHHSYALIGRAGSPYADVKSLKGKRIGVTSAGSLTDNTIRWAIKREGLQAERDFLIISVGTGAAMRAALETGQVEAGTVPSTEVSDYLRGGKFRVVSDWRTISYPALVVIGRQKWVDASPAIARAFVRAVTRGARTIQTDPQAAQGSMKQLYPNFSDEAVSAITVAARQRLSKDGSVSAPGFETMQDVVLLSDSTLRKVKKTDVDLQPVLSK